MRALILLIIGGTLLVPALLLLQQPRGQWSLVWDTLGLTFGILGTITVLIALAIAARRLVKKG